MVVTGRSRIYDSSSELVDAPAPAHAIRAFRTADNVVCSGASADTSVGAVSDDISDDGCELLSQGVEMLELATDTSSLSISVLAVTVLMSGRSE